MSSTQGRVSFFCANTDISGSRRRLCFSMMRIGKRGFGAISTSLTQRIKFYHFFGHRTDFQDLTKGPSFRIAVQAYDDTMFFVYIYDLFHELYKIWEELRFFYDNESAIRILRMCEKACQRASRQGGHHELIMIDYLGFSGITGVDAVCQHKDTPSNGLMSANITLETRRLATKHGTHTHF
jgi:hypothetical protein